MRASMPSMRARTSARAGGGAAGAGASGAAACAASTPGVATFAPAGRLLPGPRVATSAPAAGEVRHEVDQRLHALDRHRVVDRGAHAAQRAMALQADEAGGVGLGQEGLV